MKDKLKARYEAIKQDPFQRGMVVGGVLGITATVVSSYALRVNFDHRGVYIPDAAVDYIYTTGLPILAFKNGRQIVIGHS